MSEAWSQLGLSNIIVLTIYRDILKVLILHINYRDTMPVHYCHLKIHLLG